MENGKNVIIRFSYFLLEDERIPVEDESQVVIKARQLKESGKSFRIVGVNVDGETVKSEIIEDILPRGFFRTRNNVYRVDGLDTKMVQKTKVKLIDFIIDGYEHVFDAKRIPAAIESGHRVEMVFLDGGETYITSHIVEFDATSRELVTFSGHRYQF